MNDTQPHTDSDPPARPDPAPDGEDVAAMSTVSLEASLCTLAGQLAAAI